jgi:beta-glucosidase
VQVRYAKGCELWSNDQSGFNEAVSAAQNSDAAVVIVGTWSRDQNELWQGLNAVSDIFQIHLTEPDPYFRPRESTLMLQTWGWLALNCHS